MTLTVFERVILLNVLPAEGDILSLRIIRRLREALSFSDDEHAALQFKRGGDALSDGSTVPEGQIRWRVEAAQPKDIDISPKAHEIIVTRLKQLSAQKQLHMDHMDLYDKFVTEE